MVWLRDNMRCITLQIRGSHHISLICCNGLDDKIKFVIKESVAFR